MQNSFGGAAASEELQGREERACLQLCTHDGRLLPLCEERKTIRLYSDGVRRDIRLCDLPRLLCPDDNGANRGVSEQAAAIPDV